MSESDQNLKNNLSDILKDLMSMSADVIKKSQLYLNDIESKKTTSTEKLSSNISKLLIRINTNINSFKNDYDTAIKNYKPIVKTENGNSSNSPKKKLSLSLKKNGTSLDADVDLINSDEEFLTSKKEKLSPEKIKQNVSMNHVDGDSETDDDRSILNFDAAATTADVSDEEVLEKKTIEEIDLKQQVEEKTEKNVTGSESFDFDEESDNEKIQRENNELLDLLNRAVGASPEPEDEVDVALKILEIEDAYSDSDLDKSISSCSETDSEKKIVDGEKTPENIYNNSDSEGNISETENREEGSLAVKDCNIKMDKRIDQFSEIEIDKLCNIENINKRKCLKALNSLRKKRRKRLRVLSSSSSSLSSDISSTGSTTPDLVIDTQEPCENFSQPGDVSALADFLIEKLDDSNEHIEISSDSSSDVEPEEKNDIKTKIKATETNNNKLEIVLNKEANEYSKSKKIGSWRSEIFYGTSSGSEGDEPVLVASDTDEKINEDGDSKETLKLRIENNGETMVITDSDSDSDEVTFVDECFDDSITSKGRRNIRTILSDNELNELTQKAKCEEDQRILRLEEHSKNLESLQSQREDLILDIDKNGTPIITVDYNLTKLLKPHQIDGVKFMWEACYESVETLKKNAGTGCILAHCMGLGKTLQVITLIHTLFTYEITQTKYVLITCPLSTVSNWKNEFSKTFEKLTEKPAKIPRYFLIKGELYEKVKVVQYWRKTGGVLVMGYEAFQILTNEKLSTKVTATEKQETYAALINPGPDLIVCDEGHQLKNDKTLRTKALMKVKTKRRIVLTGTPLQNNLKEYYYMVEFVKPHILGTYKEYTNRFAYPIQNGQYHDSTPEDTKLMKKRTHVLTKLLKKTIHRVEATVLASYLPLITDYTIFLKLTEQQILLYTKYIHMVKQQRHDLSKGFLNDVMMLSLNNLHPYTIQLYYEKLKSQKKKKQVDDNNQEIAIEVNHISADWYQNLLFPDVMTNINYSSKLKLIFDILDECVQLGEKVLIFAQRLIELDVIESFLKICGTKNYRIWRSGVDFYRMDGATPVESREKLCKNFNTNSLAKVFLLTHRVGGLGLNLTAANRVIMIGSNHNPSLDTQSMYRVYRFGQTKKCYIYRLISLATMEEKIYHRCVVKLHLSGTVVDKLHFVRRYTANDLQEMYNINFNIEERPIPALPIDKVLAKLIKDNMAIVKYHLHNSLLENRPEEELTDEEKKLAWQEFNSMEEAAKSSTQVANNPVWRLPVFPANPTYPFNRFGQLCGPRAPVTSLVPNPMNNNIRGFVPRNLLEDGWRSSVIQSTSTAFPNRRMFDNEQFRVGPSTSEFNFTPSGQNMPRPSNVSTEQSMQNIRANIVSLLRNQPKPTNEPTNGEFNYALNKVI